MKVFLITILTFCLFSFTQAQSIDLLDKEDGYDQFKIGEIIDLSETTIYHLDTKRSTKELKAYQYKKECCTDFKGFEIDGIVLHVDNEKKLTKITFLIEETTPLAELTQYFSAIQNQYGLFSDYTLATGNETTSSFFWKATNRKLMLSITPTDESNKKYQVALVLD